MKTKIKEIREREKQETIAKGIKGKGFKGNFKTYCGACQTEYHHEAVEICNRCGKETVSNEVSLVRFSLGCFLEISGILR